MPPVYVATATKQVARRALSFMVGDYWPITTSSAGNGGGTTAVYSALTGLNEPDIVQKYLLLDSGTNAATWRFVSAFAPATGTTTVPRAYAGQVASAVTGFLHHFRPDIYTNAINQAVREISAHVNRMVLNYTLAEDRHWFSTPAGMRDVLQVMRGPSMVLQDLFDRANSTTTLGGSWVATAGTIGVSSEHLYFVSDADGDHATYDPDLKDGFIYATLRGTLNHATVIRIPALTFRIREDYTGAIDVTTCLVVRLINGTVQLRKRDGGSESNLATATQTTTDGVDYRVAVEYTESTVRVWVDNIMLIDHTLLGTDRKYESYTRTGVRLDKGGSPATDARVAEYYIYGLSGLQEHRNWTQHGDRVLLYVPTAGTALLQVEGRAPLTVLADDTFETLVTDTTALMEIQTGNEPPYGLLLNYAAYCLYEQARQPAYSATPDEKAQYAQEAKIWMGKYHALLGELQTSTAAVRRRSLA